MGGTLSIKKRIIGTNSQLNTQNIVESRTSSILKLYEIMFSIKAYKIWSRLVEKINLFLYTYMWELPF